MKKMRESKEGKKRVGKKKKRRRFFPSCAGCDHVRTAKGVFLQVPSAGIKVVALLLCLLCTRTVFK